MATKKTSRLDKHLSGELRHSFRYLLVTWIVRAAQDENYTPWEIMYQHDPEDWPQLFIELEEQCGDGHYADRKELLDTSLGYLNGRVDLEAVKHVLATAKTERRLALSEGKARDYYRRLSKHQKTVEALEALAQRALESYYRLWKVGQEELFSLGTVEDLSPVRQLRALLEALRSDPIKELSLKSSLRRPQPGHQPEPWLKRARQKLQRLRVPLGVRDDLLMAVGLTPYKQD